MAPIKLSGSALAIGSLPAAHPLSGEACRGPSNLNSTGEDPAQWQEPMMRPSTRLLAAHPQLSM